MSYTDKLRIFMTGVGGQGTLTATKLLAQAALIQGIDLSSGEIHGMAQRGGVVESTILLNCKSPKIVHGEADVVMGFEALETMRALPYLKPGGLVLSSSEFIQPMGVALGRDKCPSLDEIKAKVAQATDKSFFLGTQAIGKQAGAVQSGNIALLGALTAMDEIPIKPESLEQAIKDSLKPKLVDVNVKAMNLGIEAVRS